jgi:hypothetical protein
MASYERIARFLAGLAAAFPGFTLEAATVDVYSEGLADIPAKHLEASLPALLRTSEAFPTVARIRAASEPGRGGDGG